jgi:transcriptional regulator with XRE-family HTH domain
MGTKQRPVDLGSERGRELVRVVAHQLRRARRSRGLSLAAVAQAVGISTSWLSRMERGLVSDPGVMALARCCAVVGLDLSVRTYSGGQPIRDAGHAALLGRFHATLPGVIGWRLEVPMPRAGDQRAWDAVVEGAGQAWRYGVEAETRPDDGQAIVRRIALKTRDGAVGGVILLLPDTRQARLFRRAYATLLASQFPVRGGAALRRLRAGADPGGSAIVVC